MTSKNKKTTLDVNAEISETLNPGSLFENLTEASEFYQCGSIGYSDTRTKKQDCTKFDGIELQTGSWQVTPLQIHKFESTLFDSLPDGSFRIDNGLLMRNIESEWNIHTPIR